MKVRNRKKTTKIDPSKTLNLLAFLYVICIPLYDVPKTGIGGIAISFIFLLLYVIVKVIFLGNIFDNKQNYLILKNIVPFLIVVLISNLLNLRYFNVKTFNHTIFYLYTFLIYSVGTVLIIEDYGFVFFTKYISIGVLLASIIGFIEMSSYYIFGYEAYATFLNHGTNVGIHANIPRLRTTFNEPSHYALYLIPIFPLVVEFGNKIIILIALIALFFTLSSSAFVALILSSFVTLIFYVLSSKRNYDLIKKNVSKILYFLLIVLLLIFLFRDSLLQVFGKITKLPTMDPVRYSAWIKSIPLIIEKPIFGHGLASYYHLGIPLGVFNWYLQILLELGIVGFFSLLNIFKREMYFIVKTKNFTFFYFFIAFFIQMVGMNHYYIPGVWILLGYTFCLQHDYKKK